MNTYGEKGFMSYMTYQNAAQELSEAKYNFIIGAALTWGFGLNYLLLRFAGPMLIHLVYGAGMLPFLIAYFVLVMIGNGLVRSYDPVKCFIGYNLIAVPIGLVVCVTLVCTVLCAKLVGCSLPILAERLALTRQLWHLPSSPPSWMPCPC